ncbi:MAG: cob(I)yrinic acid a,c-diamide adenosyltransferase, partial [Thermoplasmata archaeon]|nr:cob(I)yrinic acid a,c-diamide adenosyltransferase [Thermoplasmata archaeon]
FKIVQYGRKEFVDPSNPSKEDLDLAKKALDHAREVLKSGGWDMVILDELNVAINMGLVPLEEALQLIKEKPEEVELVITGRGAPKEIIEVADLVTEMREVKHYYRKGIPARKGIEY